MRAGVSPFGLLPVSMAVGHGLRKVVQIPQGRIQPTLVIAGTQNAPAERDYQAVASNLLGERGWPSGRIFVSSPAEGDGKTCTAFNLAWALGRLKKSVLLVELNFEQPQFRSWLGDVKMRYGLDSALLGEAHPAESVFSLESNGFDVAAVRNAASPKRMERILLHLSDFLDWGSEHYELLVLDCPSVLSRDWDWWLRDLIGPTLLVVREEQTPVVTVDQAMARLGEKLKGFLLNDFSGGNGSPHRQ